MWWLYLLLLSLVCCAFITQPLMVRNPNVVEVPSSTWDQGGEGSQGFVFGDLRLLFRV
jgi:hypothetical protein